jgi:hypothetical protein
MFPFTATIFPVVVIVGLSLIFKMKF